MFTNLSKRLHSLAAKKRRSKRARATLRFETMESRALMAGDTGVSVVAAAGLRTSEDGQTAIFSLSLKSQPTADVTIPISSSVPTAGLPSVSSVTFTPANWNVPTTVTVRGVPDSIRAEAPERYRIVTGKPVTTDAAYAALTAASIADVPVVNIDSKAQVVVSPVNTPATPLVTDESGKTATVQVKLNVRPTANVVVRLAVSKTTEASLNKTRLTFTPANWNSFQSVTVTGLNDNVVDGDKAYLVRVLPAISTDLRFSGLDGADVNFVNKSVVTGAALFNGRYDATFAGTGFLPFVSSQPLAISGSFSATANNGTIQASLTLVQPNLGLPTISASGTVSDTGDVVLTVTNGPFAGFKFTGKISISAVTGVASFSGNWSFSNSFGSGQGTWSGTRTSL